MKIKENNFNEETNLKDMAANAMAKKNAMAKILDTVWVSHTIIDELLHLVFDKFDETKNDQVKCLRENNIEV